MIQMVLGPRQVGKTTGVQQFLQAYSGEALFISADDQISNSDFIYDAWLQARSRSKDCLLVIDEIQKISAWSESVKALWDAMQRDDKLNLKVLLLGSSSMSIQTGLSESLAGRYELIEVPHWNYLESKALISDLSLQDYLRYGGYPGSYSFLQDTQRWQQYVQKSIIDQVIHQDILYLRQVKKPALFKQSFQIICSYPAQIISYRKLLGQLQDQGNTDLIKHYIDLYAGSYLCAPLSKYGSKDFKIKSSSPKMLSLCPALYTVYANRSFEDQQGFIFENSVGAQLKRLKVPLFYWRKGNEEVDYVLQKQDTLYAIEVKSGLKKKAQDLKSFCTQYKAKAVLITQDNYEAFLKNSHEFLKNF